jgi:hypothetical protein
MTDQSLVVRVAALENSVRVLTALLAEKRVLTDLDLLIYRRSVADRVRHGVSDEPTLAPDLHEIIGQALRRTG